MKKPKQNLMTQTAFAKICGVSRPAVAKSLKSGTIAKVVVRGTNMVDFDHPMTKIYYEKQINSIEDRSKYVSRGKTAKKQPKNSPDVKKKTTQKSNLTDLQQLQREKVEEEIKKIKADRRLKELKYEEERGRLIEKETVAAVLFQYLDALNINMLDLGESTYDTVKDMVLSGAKRGDVIKYQREIAKRFIVDTKAQINGRIK